MTFLCLVRPSGDGVRSLPGSFPPSAACHWVSFGLWAIRGDHRSCRRNVRDLKFYSIAQTWTWISIIGRTTLVFGRRQWYGFIPNNSCQLWGLCLPGRCCFWSACPGAPHLNSILDWWDRCVWDWLQRARAACHTTACLLARFQLFLSWAICPAAPSCSSDVKLFVDVRTFHI